MFVELLYNPNYDFQTKIIIFFTFLVAVMIGMTFHEGAHAFAAHKCGDLTPKMSGRLTLNPFAHIDKMGFLSFLILGFGWAKPVPINPLNFKHFRRNMFFVSIAGVLTNLCIAFIAMPFVGLVILNVSSLSLTMFEILMINLFSYIVFLNILLVVFNLLPIYPLDGFNAVASSLKFDNKFVVFMRRYGTLVLLGLLILFDIIYMTFDISVLGYLCYYVSYPFTAFWSAVMGMPTNSIGMIIFRLGV